MSTSTAVAFTDGSSRGNPGPGGWGVICATEARVTEYGGREDRTTNNRMELRAIAEALRVTADVQMLTIYTDSAYAINGVTKWLRGWKAGNWQTKAGQDVANRDLWEEIDQLVRGREILWQALRGHVGIPGNERADAIATAFADGASPQLFDDTRKLYTVDLSPKAVATSQSGGDDRAKSDRAKQKAFSYLSLVDGEARRHATWAACEARVSGLSGVKYRKAVSLEDEHDILESWGVAYTDVENDAE